MKKINELPGNIQKKLMALHELTIRGVSGEKETAERFLIKLLSKYEVDLADLLDVQRPQEYKFHYKNEHERKILIHICAKVTDSGRVEYKEHTRSRSLYFDLTPTQAASVSSMYSVLRLALRQHVKAAVHAFIAANNLYGGDDDDSDDHEISAEYRAYLLKVAQMASVTGATAVHAQLKRGKK